MKEFIVWCVAAVVIGAGYLFSSDGGGYGDGTHFSADDDGGGGLNAWRGKTYGNGYGDIATDKRKQYAKIPDITYHSGGGYYVVQDEASVRAEFGI